MSRHTSAVINALHDVHKQKEAPSLIYKKVKFLRVVSVLYFYELAG